MLMKSTIKIQRFLRTSQNPSTLQSTIKEIFNIFFVVYFKTPLRLLIRY